MSESQPCSNCRLRTQGFLFSKLLVILNNNHSSVTEAGKLATKFSSLVIYLKTFPGKLWVSSQPTLSQDTERGPPPSARLRATKT